MQWWHNFDRGLSLIDIPPDALGVHCYHGGPGRTVLDEIRQIGVEYGIEGVWLTEFALVSPDLDAQAEFARRMYEEVIRKRPWVHRYAWFIVYQTGSEPWSLAHTPRLIEDDGSLNVVGQAYWALPPQGFQTDINRDGCVDIRDLGRCGG